MGTRRTNCTGGIASTEKIRREGQEHPESLRPRIEALVAGRVVLRAVRGEA